MFIDVKEGVNENVETVSIEIAETEWVLTKGENEEEEDRGDKEGEERTLLGDTTQRGVDDAEEELKELDSDDEFKRRDKERIWESDRRYCTAACKFATLNVNSDVAV